MQRLDDLHRMILKLRHLAVSIEAVHEGLMHDFLVGDGDELPPDEMIPVDATREGLVANPAIERAVNKLLLAIRGRPFVTELVEASCNFVSDWEERAAVSREWTNEYNA